MLHQRVPSTTGYGVPTVSYNQNSLGIQIPVQHDRATGKLLIGVAVGLALLGVAIYATSDPPAKA